MTILLTRPYNLALNSRNKIKSLGIESIIMPLIKINYLNKNIIDNGYEYIIVTSQNAVLSFKKNSWMQDRAILTVGNATKKLLLNLDCKNITLCERDVSSLINLICKKVDIASNILYVCGDHLSCDLDKELKNHGYTNVVSQIVYESQAINSLTENQVININKDVETIMFYSSRTAKIFFNLFQKHNFSMNNKIAICISKNCAGYISCLKWKDIKIADYPSENSMMELL